MIFVSADGTVRHALTGDSMQFPVITQVQADAITSKPIGLIANTVENGLVIWNGNIFIPVSGTPAQIVEKLEGIEDEEENLSVYATRNFPQRLNIDILQDQVEKNSAAFVRSGDIHNHLDRLGLGDYEVTQNPAGFILLDKNRIHGTFENPYDGDIRFWFSNFQPCHGVTIHQAGTAPNFPTITKQSNAVAYSTTSGDFNLIVYQAISKSLIIYSIFVVKGGDTRDTFELSLMLEMRFEEELASASFYDSSIYNNVGNFFGEYFRLLLIGGVKGAAFISDNAGTGGGSNRAGLNFPSTPSLNSISSQFTIAFWFFIPTGSGSGNILNNTDGSTLGNGFEILYATTRRLEVTINRSANGTTYRHRSSNEALVNGGWVFCVVRRNGTNVNMRTTKWVSTEWVSSQVFDTITSDAGSVGNSNPWNLFQLRPGEGMSRGGIEHLRVWNIWLPDTRVTELENEFK